MEHRSQYRLALDLGATSLGWCVLRLGADGPTAIVKAGVRIFSDGRNPKDGSSLAVTRRLARQARRRRDRLLKRKARLTDALVRHGLFPPVMTDRKALERLDPYELRLKGLDTRLAPHELGRAIFHINQRRGFRSNRRTDAKDSESGLVKRAIRELYSRMASDGARTVGEWLAKRHRARLGVRARLRGKLVKEKAYDLYIDRAAVEREVDALWASQRRFDPDCYPDTALAEIKGALLHQRPLKPVQPGRCTLMPEKERAPLALPSVQRFRIYQEVNNLRIVGAHFTEQALDIAQRDLVVEMLDSEHEHAL